jgi:hypothetical protein
MFTSRRDGALIILSHDPEQEIAFTLEALTQAGIIFVMGVAIIVSNVLIIATFLTSRGQYNLLYIFYIDMLFTNRPDIKLYLMQVYFKYSCIVLENLFYNLHIVIKFLFNEYYSFKIQK